MSFSVIAAVGKNRELGNKGGLCFRISEDMRFFKEMTMGHPILMGRKTFQSIGRALPGRRNLVVTRGSSDFPEEIEVISDVERFIAENIEGDEEIFVIGGGMIYEKFLPYASTIYLTEVEAAAEADTFFPEFDKSKYDKVILKKGSQDDLTYAFAKYSKK